MGNKARLLVIGDALEDIRLLQAMLTVAGYEVITADKREQMFLQVVQESPDLVILDNLIPGPASYEICAQLRINDATRLIPVILVTSAIGRDDRMQAIAAGSDTLLERPVSRGELLAHVESLTQAKMANDGLIGLENAITALATAIEARDSYAEGHIERVVGYASSLGRRIGLSPKELELLRKGSILHDIGKIGVRESVLSKQGPLSAEEMAHMKMHPIIGERICLPLRSEEIADIVRHHHESYDGRGYPDGLVGEDITLGARIMAAVDVYDALTSDRSYRRSISPDRALDILRAGAGKQFDPDVVSALVDTISTA